MNKNIRQQIYNERKKEIRKSIKPATSKSLWSSVKIAKDEDRNEIPDEEFMGNEIYRGAEVAEAFANFFIHKVSDITSTCQVDDNLILPG